VDGHVPAARMDAFRRTNGPFRRADGLRRVTDAFRRMDAELLGRTDPLLGVGQKVTGRTMPFLGRRAPRTSASSVDCRARGLRTPVRGVRAWREEHA
jgi:hypothetical protein